MWFKNGLKAQKLLAATRPERAEAPSPGRALKKSPFLRTKTENAYDL